MAWVESHQSVDTHPKTKRAARQLGVSRALMIGHLHLFWHWALDYAQDGDLSSYDLADIADAADWEGDPQTFVNALIECGPGDSAGFLECDAENHLIIHDWWEYAGKLIAKRQADAERKRNARQNAQPKAGKRAKKSPTVDVQPAAQDVQRTSNGRPSDGATNPLVNQPTNQPNIAASSDAAVTVATKPKRIDQRMHDAFIDAFGFSPATDVERNRWNAANLELRRAGVAPEEVGVLKDAFYRIYGPKTNCTPNALVSRLGELRAVHTAPPRNDIPDVTDIARQRRALREAQAR